MRSVVSGATSSHASARGGRLRRGRRARTGRIIDWTRSGSTRKTMPERIGNGRPVYLSGEPVDHLQRRLALERLGHAAADLGHRVRVRAIGDRHGHPVVALEVARLARPRLGEEGEAVALQRHPHRDGVRAAAGQDRSPRARGWGPRRGRGLRREARPCARSSHARMRGGMGFCDDIRARVRPRGRRARHVRVVEEAVPAYARTLPAASPPAPDLAPGRRGRGPRGVRPPAQRGQLRLGLVPHAAQAARAVGLPDGRGRRCAPAGRGAPRSCGARRARGGRRLRPGPRPRADGAVRARAARARRPRRGGARRLLPRARAERATARPRRSRPGSAPCRAGATSPPTTASRSPSSSAPSSPRPTCTCQGLAPAADLPVLTLFADNLVPHVLRLDGVLAFDDDLVARIEREELLEHGSPEEVEIRACAVHAVELLVAAHEATTATAVDNALWHRGGGAALQGAPAPPGTLDRLLTAARIRSSVRRGEDGVPDPRAARGARRARRGARWAASSRARSWPCCCCTPTSRSAPSGWRSRCGARTRRRARSRPCRCTSRGCARRSATRAS